MYLQVFLRSVEEDDIATGVHIYFILVFCEEESFKLFQFFKALINNETTRTLVLSTIDNMDSIKIKKCQSKQNMKLFYHQLTNILDLQLESVLEAMSTSSELQAFVEADLPFGNNKSKKDLDVNTLGE